MVSRVNPFIVTVVVLTVVIAPVNAATVAVGAPQATASSADSGLQTQAASDTGASTSEQNPGAQGIATNESTSPSRASSDPSDDPEECKRKTDSEERRGNESEEKPPRRPPDECEKDTSKEDAESSGVEKQDGLGTMDVQIQNATQDLRSIGINQTANGTIDTNDPYDTGFRGYYEPVTFNGTEGQLLKFNMRSSGDTYLYLVDPNGTVVASDDDGGDGYNSEIVRELQSTGNYTIIATSYDSDATFEYELTVEVPRDRDLRSTSVGGAVYSTIEGDDPYNSSLGAHYEPVTFQGEAGEEVSIRMQASGSRQLMLVAPNGSVITKSGEYPARIEATLPTTGNYTIIAATYDDNLVPYHLSVLRDDHKDPSRVAIGNTIKGTVDTDDSYNESFGGYYEGVSFDGQAGQDVSISFESLEYYNKIIYLVAPNGTVLLQSYVNQEATALTARLPTNGTYRVLVTSDQYGFQTFDYRLGVRTADHGDARSISYDDSVTSTLENGDPKNSTYDGYYEPVTFDGQAGDNISLSFNSEVYYGTIQLLAPNGTVMATSSEYGSGDIKAQLPTDGTYTVIVSSYYDYVQVFDYQLSLTRDSHEDLRSITQNTTRSSTLDTNDSVNSSYRGKYHEPVVFEGTAGQEVNVSMQANGEDTYLYLLAPNGTVIAENDYANIYGSRVSVTLPVTGNYTIIAASDDYDSDTFDYDLSVTVNQSDLRSIEANESMEGEIETSDPQNSTYNGYYEPVSYNGTAGERVSFETTTAEDTYLYLVAPNGTIIAENDDGGFYDSSEIAVTLPENGTYTVIVTSDYSGDTFPYLLSVDSEPVSTDLRSIGVNQTLQGEIDAADPSNSSYDGIHEPVTVNATAGEEVTITVTPSEEESTDTYLYVVSPNGTVISQADYGVVHGSRVDVSFPTNGTYTIIVATDYGNDRFKYELSVEPANHGDVRSVTVGSTVISTVDTDDPASNRFNGNYEPITFYGEAGQEISISRLRLRSEYYDGEFNLTVLSPNGTVLTKTRYYEETDVKMVLPETGNYTIVASPQRYYNNITGDYAFSIVNDTHRNARTVDLNQGVMGTLDTGDPSNSTYDGYYESIAYDGEAGQKVRIDLLPDDVQYADSYLYLVAPNGTVIAEDDYGGEGGSRIETTLPVNGTYQIIVSNDYYDRHLFDYRLSVTSMAGTPASGTANLSVSKYALSSTSVTAGESLNVTANVVNDGGISGSMTVTLYVNGSAAGQKTVTVGPGESTTVPFSVTFDAAGTKAVRVNGLAPTEVSVEPAVGTRTLSRAWTLPLDRPKTQLALGDIDADGAEEIGVGNFDSHGPTTYGVVKDGAWTWNASASAAVHPDSVGDVDGSGEPEMIFKAKVDATWVRPYDANGSSQWSGTHPDWVDQTLTVDSDDDGKAEVLAYSGNGGDLSIWDDNGSEITTAQNSSINNLLDAGDIDGDGVPEVLTNLPSTDYDGLQVLSIAVSDGSVERVATYGPEQPVRATFTDLDDDSRYEIVAAYPSGGFVTAYDINGTVQWNRTIASGDDARLRNVTGDDVPDPVVWNGSNVTVMDGATGDTVRTNVSNTVRSALGRGDGSVAVLTESSVTVVADGQVVDSVAVDGTNVTAFAGGDTDGDDEEELVVANKSLLTVYDVNVTEETASFQVRDISAPPSASVGSDVVVS
ncbi:MAG: pre-peptidase C-terminal domain-containing protein, partial [Halolamina sp.]